MNLTPEEVVFCREYVAEENSLVAFRCAYPDPKAKDAPKDVAALMRNPWVRARIAELQRRKRGDLGLTPEWVLAHLKDEVENHRQGSSQSARVTALNLLMRHFGMYTAVPPAPEAPKIDLSKLTDAQQQSLLHLLHLASGGDAQPGEAGNESARASVADVVA
jgi:hypothetical protein